MKRMAVASTLALAVGIVVGAIGMQILNAQQAPVRATELLKTDVVGMEGKEVIVQFVEIAPGGTTGKHYHPGHEAFYVMAGSGILEMEGNPSRSVKPGDTNYIPAKKIHEGKNDSKSDQLKLVVFRIHEKGQPITVKVP
jgi:quercetin dioxygenase-like cupin family protein